ncbi:MAG: proline--tRNA ligase [Oligoflexia bacterium]|nr:proline--tRNA ligase [Oligoflexia bacterium]
MRLSKYLFHSLKESPQDAEIESHRLLVRAGFIKKLAPGIYSYLPLALRSIRKFEDIVREELNKSGAIEILMPMVQPQELWDESGRWDLMGKGLLKFKDRNEHSMCLGPTHEEVVTDIARREIKSYRDLPLNLYQIQTKYRDEIRPRFGLMRGKEFIMKDAYSFDVSKEAALKSYELMFQAYKRIFKRCGLSFRTVRADSGAIGGSHTHEFQVLAQSGEDQIMACEKCDYASNIEITPVLRKVSEASHSGKAAESFETPGLKTIDDLAKSLKVKAEGLVKTLFVKGDKGEFICVLIRGSDEINLVKLKNQLGLENTPELSSDHEVLKLTGANPGSCGPVGLKIRTFCDQSLKAIGDWVVGANKDGFHLKNVKPGRDFSPAGWGDFTRAVEGDPCPDCGGKLNSHRGIEVGHVFYLGDKYSKSLKANFLDEKGQSKPAEMGCYGIGITRTVQAAIEQNHDKDGMIWPVPLAPFQVYLALLDINDAQTVEAAEKIYDSLTKNGVEVLLDDRDERPGVKFKDADLMGLPVRINIGKRSLAEGFVEFVERRTKTQSKVSPSEVISKTKQYIESEIAKSRE